MRLISNDRAGPHSEASNGRPHVAFTLRCRACAAPALAGRVPLPRGGKPVSAHTLASLDVAASKGCRWATDARRNHCRWWRGSYADHTGRTRRAESRRPVSGCAVRRLAPRDAAAQRRRRADAAGRPVNRHLPTSKVSAGKVGASSTQQVRSARLGSWKLEGGN
jgi:hypothetical protein